MYGANAFSGKLPDGSSVEWIQETGYPWDETVKITLKRAPGASFAIRMRIPSWADGASVGINGNPFGERPVPGTYLELNRAWKEGDVVELVLPMRVRLVEGHPRVETTRNHLAVFRGPILYCLESPDLPEAFKVPEIYLPREVKLAPRHDRDLLGGVTILEGEAVARKQGDWSGSLYREVRPETPVNVPLRLIPYFAWCNRGVSEMTVWIPAI
jgi:hypothetical protein